MKNVFCDLVDSFYVKPIEYAPVPLYITPNVGYYWYTMTANAQFINTDNYEWVNTWREK